MIEDNDYSTDQSMRITRRVANGVYRLTHGTDVIGEEVWGIFALRNGGFRLMTEIDLHWPVPNQQRARLDVGAAWDIQALWAQVDVGATRRIATYTPSDYEVMIDIVEMQLHPADEADGRKGHGRASPASRASAQPRAGPGAPVLQRRMPFGPTTHLDFGSGLFNHVVLRRLPALQNGTATFGAIVLTLPSLEPLPIQQTYRYLQDEPLEGDANHATARRYSISEINAQGAESAMTTFWTDPHGITIRQELLLDGVPHGCEMTSYRWQG